MNYLFRFQFLLSLLLAAFIPMGHAQAAAGDLYEADQGSGTIFRFTPTGEKSVFASGFAGLVGLAFDRQGNLFASDSGAGSIFKLSPAGVQSTFASGLDGPTGLAFDHAGNLYATTFNGGTVYRFTPDGTQSTYASGLTNPVNLVFDSTGNLFVSDLTAGTVYSIAPNGEKTVYNSGFVNPAGLAFDSAGNLFVSDLAAGEVYKFTAAGVQSTFASLTGAAGLAFDQAGQLFAVSNTDGVIVKIASDGTQSSFASGLSGGALLAFEPEVGKFRNFSARGTVATGDNVLIGGFIVGGNALLNNKVVVRALGPSLSSSGVTDALQDPILELRDGSGALIASNDNWQDTQGPELSASGLAPTKIRESAILITLPAGGYTAIVKPAGSGTGVALLEVYDTP